MENGTILALDDIGFTYPKGPRVLEGFSLTLGEGVFGLLGPNGAGKTTLMKLLLGFLKPSTGRGSVFGVDIGAEPLEVRRRIGFMPESDCLIPGFDGVAFTAYLGELSGMPRREAIRRAHDVLYYVGLEESRYRRVETYSTGMKQRLKLAAALVHDPRLLLLDEPTSGLDPDGRREMLALIQDIARRGTLNIVFSTHLLTDVEETCREVVILNEGRIVARHSIEALGQGTGTTVTVGVVGDPAPFLAAVQQRGGQVSEGEHGLFLVVLPRELPVGELFVLARTAGRPLRHLKPVRSTLEEAFLRAVGESA